MAKLPENEGRIKEKDQMENCIGIKQRVNFLKEMDSSIWDPPEDPDESSTYLANSWQYNLYFDPRLDMIEEDALNKKSCLQVLKIMIKKADSEIAELEDDILMLQRQLACEDDMRFAELNKKIANLDNMLRTLKNENEQPAEPGVESSNLPEEDLNKTEATDDHNSKDIKTVKFKDGCTAQVLASLVQVRNQQETHAGTTLEDRHSSEQEGKEYSSKPTQRVDMDGINSPYGMKGQEVVHTETDCTIEDTRPHLLNSEWNYRSYPKELLINPFVHSMRSLEAIDNHNSKDIKTVEFRDGCTAQANNAVLASLVQVRNHEEIPAGTTLEDRHVSEQETKEYSSKPTQKGDMDGIKSPYGMKGQEVVHTETDCTIEDTRPHLLNSEWNYGSYLRKKLKSGGYHYQDKTIMETQRVAGAERAGGFADISTTSQFHLTKSSGAPVIQENKDQRNVRNTLVKSYGRTSQEPLVMHRYSYDYTDVHNVKVAFPMSSSTPSPRIPDINKMSLVQLRALANRHNIYGVSVMRKADLQQLLRSKLPYWS